MVSDVISAAERCKGEGRGSEEGEGGMTAGEGALICLSVMRHEDGDDERRESAIPCPSFDDLLV